MMLLILIISLFASVPLFGQTLQEVVQSALEFNRQIKADHMQSKAAESDLFRANRRQLPVLSLNARYAHATEEPQIILPAPFNRTITLNPHDSYETSLQLNYVIFSGFAQSQAIRVKDFEHKISQINEHQTTKKIAFTTIQTYRNAQFLKLSLGILNDALQRNKVQMQKAKALLENGMALKLDTLSLTLNILDIQQQIIQSQSVMENWLQLLKSLSGQEVILSNASTLSDLPLYNEYDLGGQSLYKNIRLQQQKINSFKGIAAAKFYPKIYLDASYNYGKPGIDVIKNDWSSYGKWVIGMQWEIWNWYADQAATRAAEYQFKALQMNEITLKDKLQLEYDKALRTLLSLKKQYKVAQQSVKVAQEKMHIIEVSTENGQLSASDFNEANLELSQAQLRQKQILVQLHLQASELDYLSGAPIQSWRY